MRDDLGSKVSCRLRAHPLQVLGPDGPLPTNRMSELLTYGSVGGVGVTPAPTRQRMGASRSGHLQSVSQWRLAPTAHAERWTIEPLAV